MSVEKAISQKLTKEFKVTIIFVALYFVNS